MRLPAPNDSGDFQPLPAGTYTARCYRIVDLGTQSSTWQGKTTEKHKVMLSWEVDEQMADGRPFTVSKRYTWSMHPKAVLRKDLEAWRNKPFTDADFGTQGFDVRKLLGVACTLVVSQTADGDKTYTNVAGVGPLMKGVKAPPQVNPSVFVSLDPEEFDLDAFNSLSERLQDTIRNSPEYQDMIGATRSSQDYNPQGRRLADELEDEIPF